jgi:hypothetical protein
VIDGPHPTVMAGHRAGHPMRHRATPDRRDKLGYDPEATIKAGDP